MPTASASQRQHLAALLQSDHTFTTVLLAILTDEYGTAFFSWEPETLHREVLDTFGAILSDLAAGKIWAGVTLLTTDQLYRTMEGFNAILTPLNDQVVDFVNFDPIDANEMAWGLTEAVMLLGEDFSQEYFSEEVCNYAGQILAQEDIVRPPPLLKFATMPTQEFSESPSDVMLSKERKQSDGVQELELYVRRRYAALLAQLKRVPLLEVDSETRDELTGKLSNVLGRQSAGS